jgi:nucleoside-diphosphate-sugar epimerase
MACLITGASGFLGGRLAQVLSEQGERVRILARRSSNLSHLEGLPVDIIYGSLDDVESIRQATAGCRVIYHCAGAVTDWAAWKTYYTANVVGVQHMVDAAARVSTLERLVHISTSDVYGFPVQACDETYPLMDIGLPYNRTKIMGERIVWEAARSGLPVTVLRPASIYGPRSKDFVFEIAALIIKSQMIMVSGGRSRAGLVYVDNAVDCILRAAHASHALGQVYNVRDETDETWRQYVDALAGALGKPPPRLSLSSGLALILARLFERVYRALRLKGRPFVTRHAVLVLCRDQGYGITKAQRELGFESKVSFEEGVCRSAAWFLDTASPVF